VSGIRSFVVGTGGARLYPVLFPRSRSVVHDDATFGVLRLRLAAEGYAWRFLPVGRGTFTDTGSGTCR
jgi:acid phosphatase type 7